MNLKKNATAFVTILRKETVRVIRIWQQTLLPSVITMTLYLVIFGEFLGSRIQGMAGFSYIQFIVPGIVMIAVITNSYSNVVSSFFGAKFQKSIEELLISPTSRIVVITGYVMGGVIRGLIVGVLVITISLFFTKLVLFNITALLAFILLTAIVFSLAGLINGILAKKFDDVSIVPTFVLTPLTYLGGVFYSIDLLPTFWQTVSRLNPILYMVNGFRFGFLGVSDINVYFGLAMLLVFTIGLFWINMYLLKKGIGLKQ